VVVVGAAMLGVGANARADVVEVVPVGAVVEVVVVGDRGVVVDDSTVVDGGGTDVVVVVGASVVDGTVITVRAVAR